ncbi:PTS lactose/cellobiose transporter subunit IIA [Candidatus Stoquefichus massiliensis]|uniref:PTS lactose/cellobiose transporter subunit IIA n=1 Tax=Candidatus Stoquefichus massiliensis TaxID=1470350 RepID=UPI000482F259|nr:PTS lactose/cellobiose transporter subunit IIA [Candidatus Stoquefichus massiliensis]
MEEYTINDLNQLAMDIILYAGDCRNLVNEAFKAAGDGKDYTEIKELFHQARLKITKAHKLQTDVIQSTIFNEKQDMTMLFIHAQDTLMTINSELFISENILQLYYKNGLHSNG